MIAAGRLKGRLAYYDDADEGDAIVFVSGPPAVGALEVVRQSSLREATPEEEAWWNAHNVNEIEYARVLRALRDRDAAKADADLLPDEADSPDREGEHVPNPPYTASISVVIKSGRKSVHMERECTIPFVPHAGMSLKFGTGDDCDWLDVDDVDYWVDEPRLTVFCSVPEKMYEPQEHGPMRLIDPLEHVPQLKSAGFRVEFEFTEPKKSPSKKKPPRGGK